MDVSRRDFLKLLGISSTGVALASAGCDTVWSVPDAMYEKAGAAPRIESWKSSTCAFCPGHCGLRVRLIDGIPVRITGNPLHPVNRGGICPLGEAGIEALFDPDRLKYPVQRAGKRGESRWERISWDEALSKVNGRLRELRAEGKANSVMLWTRETNSLRAELFRDFMHAYGSTRIQLVDEGDVHHSVMAITQGHARPIEYRFDDIDLLLNFGADLLDDGPSPLRFNQLYAQLRNRERGKKMQIVHVSSRLSRTAGKSTEWIPVLPGTMGALALGIAHVLITDRQYDAAFTSKQAFGFDDWTDASGVSHPGFRTLALKEHTPEETARRTGIPAVRIVELARDFGEARTAVALGGTEVTHSTNGLFSLWAIDCLNALKGNYRNGVCTMVSMPPFTPLAGATVSSIAAGERPAFEIPRVPFDHHRTSAREETPTTPEVLFLADVDPMFHSHNRARLRAALEEIPLIVSFSQCIDDTSAYADLILPDCTALEGHEVYYNTAGIDVPNVTYNQPVVAPLHETRATGDVLLQICRTLGDEMAAALPWASYDAYLAHRLERLYSSGKGTIFTEQNQEGWLKYLKDRGWQPLAYSSLTEYLGVLAEKGGWWDPAAQGGDFISSFRTPSGRYEFSSQTLAARLAGNSGAEAQDPERLEAVLKSHRITARGDTVRLPHYEAPRFYAPDEAYALHLMTFPVITSANGRAGNLPMMQEIFGLMVREFWTSWVEIGTETALRYGISDGDMVIIAAPAGELKLKAKVHPGIQPGTVYIPYGMGHRHYGRYARGNGVNPCDVLQEDFDFLSGTRSLNSTMVALRPATRTEAS